MGVERRPVHHGVARSAVPTGVSTAAVTEARDVTDQYLIRAEGVAVRASARRLGHPPTRDPDQTPSIAQTANSMSVYRQAVPPSYMLLSAASRVGYKLSTWSTPINFMGRLVLGPSATTLNRFFS